MNDSQIKNLSDKFGEQITAAKTLEQLELVRIGALGKKGEITSVLKSLGSMDEATRKTASPKLNELKTEIVNAINNQRQQLRKLEIEEKLKSEKIDITLPANTTTQGTIHPISQVIDELINIFSSMGFKVAEGPDIETDYYNFTALNFPPSHPAREMHDTFFFEDKNYLLRTHTSPVQIRTMENTKPPIRIIIPGKTYRQDSDATHSPMFHQLEGLVVDETANIANLKHTLQEFCKAFFEVENLNMRFRPSFFPFTEPSLEVDIQCSKSGGQIKFGQGIEWMEILGAGMVHPNVLRAGGLDSEKYQGFAWGIGIDRLAMLKYGMPDLRPFFESDQRWLNHYGFRPLDIPSLFGGLSR